MTEDNVKTDKHVALTPDEAARLFAGFVKEGDDSIAVAVSGGPDSMALTFCLQRYAGLQNITALIVEHGLRAESAAEAAAVATTLRGMGLETEILPWTHDTIASRVHVQARDARYALLVEACKKRGIKTLFLAHHADDQAETVLMRFAKGSGIDGLAGMAAVTEMDGVSLIRPLLSVPKTRLMAICVTNNISYVMDPSNNAEKYARGRLRRVMPLLVQEGMTVERLVDLAERAREFKEALDYYAQKLLRASVQIIEGGAYRLDLTALRSAPRATAMRSVGLLLSSLNKGSYLPERKKLIPFFDWLSDQDLSGAKTFYGCLIQKDEAYAKATFLREEAAIKECPFVHPQETLVWDGRWHVCYNGEEKGLSVKALGQQSHELLDRLAPELRRRVSAGRMRATLPALWRGGEVVAVPIFNVQNQGVISAVFLTPFWYK